jgi:hypothetical protein
LKSCRGRKLGDDAGKTALCQMGEKFHLCATRAT